MGTLCEHNMDELMTRCREKKTQSMEFKVMLHHKKHRNLTVGAQLVWSIMDTTRPSSGLLATCLVSHMGFSWQNAARFQMHIKFWC